jgi:hypothetical protein
MSNVVDYFYTKRLSVGIKDSVAVDVYLEKVAAVYCTALLRFKACPFSDVSYYLRSFDFLLDRVIAVL